MNNRVAWIAAGAVLLVHALGNAHYGYFRDELYFIICGRHPQFGYVDQPPVVPFLAALTQAGGHSLWLLRIVPALFAAAGAFVTVLLTAEFGGGIFAQLLASIVFLFCPVFLSFGGKAGPDEVGLFTWPLIAYLVVRITKGADARLWLAAGAVAGFSLESKYSVIFFLVALVIGLLLTPQRSILFNRWCALGTVIAAIVALPNFLWQAHYGFPMWELLRNGQNGKNIIAGPWLYLAQQVLITGMFLAPVWIIGVAWLFTRRSLRFLGIAYVALIAMMIALHGKHYYPAAGAVPIEAWTSRFVAARVAVVAYALLLGPLFVPYSLPILPETTFVSYQSRLFGVLHIPRSALATEHGRDGGTLPGDWADMHGWPEMAQTIATIYNGLPAKQRAQAVVVASNYGEAAAVEFFEPYVPVISRHNQYWLWGTRGYSGNVIIDVDGDCGATQHLFATSERAATFNAPYARESDIPIMVCTGISKPLSEIWPSIKVYE
jgi:Dolichyl-phosphate-mannose-protein mannosyltransferase